MTSYNDTEEYVEANHELEFAAYLLLNGRKSPEQAKQILIEDGIDAQRAHEIVDHLDLHITTSTRERAQKDLLYGSLWCLGGALFSIISYQTGSFGSGWYVLTYGAIVIGSLQFLKGVFRF